jgi:hypothetical protein
MTAKRKLQLDDEEKELLKYIRPDQAEEYLLSGLSPHDFLYVVGHKMYKDGWLHIMLLDFLRSSYRKTKDPPDQWLVTLQARKSHLTREALEAYKQQQVQDDNLLSALDVPSLPMVQNTPNLAPAPGESLTQVILRFRREQAQADFVSAHNLRLIIQKFMSWAFQTTSAVDPTTGRLELVPRMKPADMRQIAGALRDIQSVQRTALGLPVDNVGFDLEGVDTTGKHLPKISVFIKQMMGEHTDPDKPKTETSASASSITTATAEFDDADDEDADESNVIDISGKSPDG